MTDDPTLETPTVADPVDPPISPAAPAAEWPEDWRARLAAGDQRLEKRLGRFVDPRSVVDSLLSAEQRLRGGQRAAPPEDDAASLDAWRAENGVPASADAYELDLPDGMILGEADQPIVDGFLESAYAANMSAAQVNQALGWYYRQHDAQQAAQAEADQAAHGQTVQELREAWGRDYPAAINQVDAFLDSAPPGFKENLLGARLADGALLGDSAPAILWLRDLAAGLAPAPTLAPGAQGGPAKALGDEIAAIERRMREDRAGYFKDETAQARYRDLVAARDRSGRR